jgi:hypothetical protein
MARIQYNDDSNPCVGSPSARAAMCDVDPSASLHERHAQGAFNATFGDSSFLDEEADTFSSNLAQQDDNESHTNTNDVSVHQNIDSLSKGAGHPNTLLADYEKNFFESESANQPCYCPCHDRSFNKSQAALRMKQELNPLERWNAEHPSEGSTVSLWQYRGNLSPCGACSCYSTMGGSACAAGDSSDKDQKSKRRA